MQKELLQPTCWDFHDGMLQQLQHQVHILLVRLVDDFKEFDDVGMFEATENGRFSVGFLHGITRTSTVGKDEKKNADFFCW